MKRLSAHFLLEEFAHSDTHPELVVPVPTRFVPSLTKLVDTVIEPLRVEFDSALRVLSGYRSPKLNTAVGGSATSQHLAGEAVDLTPISRRPALALFDVLRRHVAAGAPLPHGQAIWYPDRDFVHVALPSMRYGEPTFCVHLPSRGLHYQPVAATTDVAHLLGLTPPPVARAA